MEGGRFKKRKMRKGSRIFLFSKKVFFGKSGTKSTHSEDFSRRSSTYWSRDREKKERKKEKKRDLEKKKARREEQKEREIGGKTAQVRFWLLLVFLFILDSSI